MNAVDGEGGERRARSRLGWQGAAWALALASAAIFVIWAVAVPPGPEVCALTYPGPRNCFVADRVSAAIVWTTALGVLALALALVFVLGRIRRPAVVVSGIVLVVIASAASYSAVAWIPALA